MIFLIKPMDKLLKQHKVIFKWRGLVWNFKRMVSGRVKLLSGTVIFSGVTIIFGPPANIRYRLTVLMHNSGHFGPPYRFGPLGPPALPGLPMASYATGHFYQLVVDSWLRLRSAIRFQGRWKYATRKRVEMFFSVIENVAHTRSPLPFFSRRSFYSSLSLSLSLLRIHTHILALSQTWRRSIYLATTSTYCYARRD